MKEAPRFSFLFSNTLAWRLFILSSLAAIVGVVVVGYFISENFRASAEKRLQDVLTANVFNLMGTVQLDDEGRLSGFPDLGDARYGLFDSGWYWSVEQIGSEENRLASSSLAGQTIDIPDTAGFDETFQRNFDMEDAAGKMLSGLEAQVFLGEGNDLFSFKVTANKNALYEEIASFRRTLFVTLSVFALSLVLAMLFLVRLGLQPLSRATRVLGDIRKGDATHIEGTFPDEIQPLIDETNALISSNTTIVERARTQVGNLAHSLKTPLAVIQNEISTLAEEKRSILTEQSDIMRQQVQVYLDRARISARSSTAIASTPIYSELDKLVSVVAKLHRNQDVSAELEEIRDVNFEGEAHDLQEIFGNLIENAAKYAKSQVLVTGSYSSGKILITVEDDGEGMSEKQIETALRRGGRIDEGKTGWGLGLSIVTDIIDEYNADLMLSRSELGGLKAEVGLIGNK